MFDAVTPPSLRGAKYLAPYGHDGRFASLRDFVRNVIVNEFAGPEPSGQVLDALETYINEISFLPNPKLAGRRTPDKEASDAARRGEALFNKPFPHNAAMSCAAAISRTAPSSTIKVHDIGTGGWFKTKTLLNAKFNAPYFHDGRFDSYDQVVGYFDRHFDLGLTANERTDLVAYLDAVGDAEEPSPQHGASRARRDRGLRQRARHRDSGARHGGHRPDRRLGRQRMARIGREFSGGQGYQR